MYHCTLQLGKGKTRSCDNDLVHETDEIELTITNHSIKKNTFVIQMKIQVLQLSVKMNIK